MQPFVFIFPSVWPRRHHAAPQIPSKDLGRPEDEAGHLRSSPQELPQVPGAQGAHAGPLEAPGGPVQGQPKDGAQGAGAGRPRPHLLPPPVSGRPVGGGGMDIGLQIRQQRQSESPGRRRCILFTAAPLSPTQNQIEIHLLPPNRTLSWARRRVNIYITYTA